MNTRRVTVSLALVIMAVAVWQTVPATAGSPAFEGPVLSARCGPGSNPERGLQGEVPAADRSSGRSKLGNNCNLVRLGQYRGQGSGFVSPSYGTCSYQSQASAAATSGEPGVHVVDVRNPRRPVLSARLTSPAMLSGTWESLKVNARRGLLAGVAAGNGLGPAFFDVYDVRTECRRPRLLNSVSSTSLTLPANTLGHEGGWSPDGLTYWSASAQSGRITAIDVEDTSHPRIVYTNDVGFDYHGFSLSPDGRTMYMAMINSFPPGRQSGLVVLDVSEVQDRKPGAQIKILGSATWADGSVGQHAEFFVKDGRRYVVFVDELSAGAARIIDVHDDRAPRVVTKLKLEIHMPKAAAARKASAGGSIFGYEGHYCSLDRPIDPTALACAYFESGVRVFSIRDLFRPQEIAYYNPRGTPAATLRDLPGSEHVAGLPPNGDRSTDWCSSPPRFVAPDQLWVTCQDNGFLALQFRDDSWRHDVGARP